MKRLLLSSALIALSLLGACAKSPPTAESVQRKQTQQLTQSIQASVGLPRITNYNEVKLVNRIYELRDRADLPTYTYSLSMNGELLCLGKSIGYGVPYATQRSNPEAYYYGRDVTLPQAEPNGLYMPSSAEATWVIFLDDEGKQHVSYVEERLIVLPFKHPRAKVQC